MRGKVLIFLLINIIVVLFLLNSLWTLLSLLVVDGSEDAIIRAELPAPNSDAIEKMPKLIPKIIHQTYKNSSIPLVWQEAQQSCIDLHPDYEYILWTDEKAREFIAKEYVWFLDTWDGYPYPIMRADAIRYFVLAYYGGVYIDLDDGCTRRLDPLLAYPAWVRLTTPTGISNDVMGSVPGHAFFLSVIEKLDKYNHNWLSPYITIMSSTGPLFLSLIWRHYNTADPEPFGANRVRVLGKAEYMGNSWSFFSHHLGNSWHKWDTQTILWMSRHWIELTIIVTTVVLCLLVVGWWLYRRTFIVQQRTSAHNQNYYRNHHRSRSSQQALQTQQQQRHRQANAGPPFGYDIIRRIPLLRWLIIGRGKDYIELRNVDGEERRDLERRDSLGRPSE